MGIEIPPLLGRHVAREIALQECRADCARECDFPYAGRTVGLAIRRHRHLPLPARCYLHFIAFLDSVESENHIPPIVQTVPNHGSHRTKAETYSLRADWTLRSYLPNGHRHSGGHWNLALGMPGTRIDLPGFSSSTGRCWVGGCGALAGSGTGLLKDGLVMVCSPPRRRRNCTTRVRVPRHPRDKARPLRPESLHHSFSFDANYNSGQCGFLIKIAHFLKIDALAGGIELKANTPEVRLVQDIREISKRGVIPSGRIGLSESFSAFKRVRGNSCVRYVRQRLLSHDVQRVLNNHKERCNKGYPFQSDRVLRDTHSANGDQGCKYRVLN